MKITVDISMLRPEELANLAKNSNDRDVLLEMFDATKDDSVRCAIIRNRHITPEDREILYNKARTACELAGVLGSFCVSELTSTTIDAIVGYCGRAIGQCYELVKQQNISTKTLESILDTFLEGNEALTYKFELEILEYIVQNYNANEEIIEKAIIANPSVMPAVMKRKDVSVKITLNKQKEE